MYGRRLNVLVWLDCGIFSTSFVHTEAEAESNQYDNNLGGEGGREGGKGGKGREGESNEGERGKGRRKMASIYTTQTNWLQTTLVIMRSHHYLNHSKSDSNGP